MGRLSSTSSSPDLPDDDILENRCRKRVSGSTTNDIRQSLKQSSSSLISKSRISRESHDSCPSPTSRSSEECIRKKRRHSTTSDENANNNVTKIISSNNENHRSSQTNDSPHVNGSNNNNHKMMSSARSKSGDKSYDDGTEGHAKTHKNNIVNDDESGVRDDKLDDSLSSNIPDGRVSKGGHVSNRVNRERFVEKDDRDLEEGKEEATDTTFSTRIGRNISSEDKRRKGGERGRDEEEEEDNDLGAGGNDRDRGSGRSEKERRKERERYHRDSGRDREGGVRDRGGDEREFERRSGKDRRERDSGKDKARELDREREKSRGVVKERERERIEKEREREKGDRGYEKDRERGERDRERERADRERGLEKYRERGSDRERRRNERERERSHRDNSGRDKDDRISYERERHKENGRERERGSERERNGYRGSDRSSRRVEDKKDRTTGYLSDDGDGLNDRRSVGRDDRRSKHSIDDSYSKRKRHRSPDRSGRDDRESVRRKRSPYRDSYREGDRDSSSNYRRSRRSSSFSHERGRSSRRRRSSSSNGRRDSTSPKPSSSSKRGNWRFDSPPKEHSSLGKESSNFSGVVTDADRATYASLLSSLGQGGLAMGGTFSTTIDGIAGIASSGPFAGEAAQISALGLIAQSIGLSPESQKAARELYVGNLPPGIDVNQLIEFLNAAMIALQLSPVPGNPAVRAWIASDGHFAFVEFRSIEEATVSLQLNSLNCLGYSLRVGRPKTYPPELATFLAANPQLASIPPAVTPPAATTALAALAAATGQPVDTQMAIMAAQSMITTGAGAAVGATSAAIVMKPPDRLAILDLPGSEKFSEEQLKTLVSQFGTATVFQYFDIPQGSEGSGATSVCIFEMSDQIQQQKLMASLNGRVLNNHTIRIVTTEEAIVEGRLSEVMKLAAERGRDMVKELGGELMRPQVPTRVIMLSNLVTAEEVAEDVPDDAYNDIVDDVKFECLEYGTVVDLVLPRPTKDDPDQSDVGYAFVEFTSVEAASAARKSLSGRKFAGRTVEAHYFSEKQFKARQLKKPQPNFTVEGSSRGQSNAELEEEAKKQQEEEERAILDEMIKQS